jgi:hypothetical protein
MATTTIKHNKGQHPKEHDYLEGVTWAILVMGISLAIIILS